MITLIADTIRQGGWIMWPIILASLVVWWLGLWKLYTIVCFRRARNRFLKLWKTDKVKSIDALPSEDDPYYVLYKGIKNRRITTATFGSFFREFLLESITELGSGLRTMGVWISVAPLLGLLGTVVGMIETFKMITLFGAGNPSFTAEGISIALLTTEAGLTVAFPGMLLLTFVVNRKNKLQRQLFSDGEYMTRQLSTNFRQVVRKKRSGNL